MLDGSRRVSSVASMLHRMYLVESSAIRKQAHGIAIGGEDSVVAGRKCALFDMNAGAFANAFVFLMSSGVSI